MFFPSAAAAVAAAGYQKSLGGSYHPPNPLRIEDLNADALTVALDVYQTWAVLLTLAFTIIIFSFLAFCLCSKRDDGYDEFEVSHGIRTVKICHDRGENGVSLLPRLNGSETGSLKATDETSEASSRYTLKRELPAIPTSESQYSVKAADSRHNRPGSQHSSELYASVSDPTLANSNVKIVGGVQVLPASAIAPGGRAAVVKETVSSPDNDQTDAGKYSSKTKSDGFNFTFCQPPKKLTQKKEEHAYAKVGQSSSQDTDTDNYDDPKVIADDRKKQNVGPMQKSSQHSDLASLQPTVASTDKKTGAAVSPHLTSSMHSTFSSHSSAISPTSHSRTAASPTSPADIPAATAITGCIRANEELPYMTPPVLQPADQQQHFSGDSQDSRGYTSISVREPLAALKAREEAEKSSALSQLGHPNSGQEEGYYMTVSDDSADETYACIYEGGSRGTGSETYAQIEPRNITLSQSGSSVISPSAANVPSATSPLRSQPESPPAPPSVDSLRHVVHSRQASASSATSTGMGSPVSEKRGARSPLPPVPQGDTDLYSPPPPPPPPPDLPPSSPSHQTQKSPVKITPVIEKPTPRALEEMYAKVMKKQRAGHSRASSSGGGESDTGESGPSSRRSSTDVGGNRWSATSPNSAKSPQDIGMSYSLIETRNQDALQLHKTSRAKSCDVSSSWSGVSTGRVPHVDLDMGMNNYETIPSKGESLYSGSSDPGYETVKNGEPPYASVDQQDYPGYETVNRGSDLESEPGYETLKHKDNEPGYETVLEAISKGSSAREPGYESVQHLEEEPGYETVATKHTADPGYESVQTGEKDYDPGYEELSHPRSASESDSNYEPLKFSTSGGPGQESRYGSFGKVEGNYDLMSDYETQTKDFNLAQLSELDNQASIPLYASVKKKESPKEEFLEDIICIEENRDDTSDPEKQKPSLMCSTSDILLEDFCHGSKDSDSKTRSDDNEVKSNSETDSLKVALGSPEVLKEELLSLNGSKLEESPRKFDEFSAFSSSDVTKEVEHLSKETASFDLNNAAKGFEIMDSSPEEVELPPPGEGSVEKTFPIVASELVSSESKDACGTMSSTFVTSYAQNEALVSLTFTGASPATGSPETSSPRSGQSNSSSSKECTDKQTEKCAEHDLECSGSVKESTGSGSESQSNNIEESLPPPPLPSVDDVTASPPPPPPPIEDSINIQDLPPPPFVQEPPTNFQDIVESSVPEENFNGVETQLLLDTNIPSLEQVSPGSQDQASSSTSDFPLPPPPLNCEEKEEDSDESSVISAYKKNANGSITVTVNPMADMDDTSFDQQQQQSTPVTTISTPSQSSVLQCTASSESSGSTVNGSVESVVTVDIKTGADPTTSSQQPPPPPLQHCSSTSSSNSSSTAESKHSDNNEGITSV